MKKKEYIILIVLVLCACGVRLYANITAPLVDYHSSHQASTMSVARNFVKDGLNLLYPQHNDRYNYQYGVENPDRYYLYEFPLYSAVVASISSFFPGIAIEIIGRAVSVISSLVVISIVYYLLLKKYGVIAALFAGSIFSFFPFFVFFSRVALSDMFVSALYMGGLLCFTFFQEYHIPTKKHVSRISGIVGQVWYSLSLICYTIAVLIKPGLIFFILPFLYMFFQKYGVRMVKKYQVYLFFIISIIPITLWVRHVSQYPEGIPFSYFIDKNTELSLYMRYLLSADIFLYTVLYVHVLTYILGGFLIIFIFMCFFIRTKYALVNWFLVSCLLYLFVFQMKHAEYEFYHVLVLPAFAMSIGIGMIHLFRIKEKNIFIMSFLLTLFIIAFSFYISYRQAQYFFDTSDEKLQIAKVIKTLTKENDQIITDTDGNTTLLYVSNRTGASTLYNTPEQLNKKGYAYVVTQKQETREEYKNTYQLNPVFENDKFSLFRL